MTQKKTQQRKYLVLVSSILFIFLLFVTNYTSADPTGATYSSNVTDAGPTIVPSGHTADRSTITTMILDGLQQSQRWKAYVGNVTGSFTLDNANNYTIYSWPQSGTQTGEVIVGRSSSLDFSAVSCAAAATVSTEETFHNMTGSEADSIGSTFNSTNHTTTTIAGTALSNCNSTALYRNDTRQIQNDGAPWQEFLAEDNGGDIFYVSIISDDQYSFINGSFFDFQIILPESDVKASATTYYFYVELG